MKALPNYQSGLTLLELLLVIGILSILFAIGFVSVANIRVISSNSNTTTVIISDLRGQQTKAMSGDTEGRGTPDNYGVKILSNRYVLFHGMTYNASDTSNFSVPIDSGYSLTTTFPNATLLFASESGELVGFVGGQNTVSMTNTQSGQSKTIQINKYGTVTTVD